MHPILNFYEKVYAKELSHAKSMHLYSSRIIKRFFISKTEDLLTGEYPLLPISFKDGDELSKTIELKGNEIELTYFSIGRISRFISLNQHETTRIYPLFKYKATLQLKEGEYYVSIDLNSREVMRTNISAKITADTLFKKINVSPLFDFHSATKLCEIIQKNHPNQDADELMLFPKLWTNKQLKAIQKTAFKVEEKYVPLGVLAVVEKETNSFTTQFELAEIAKTNDLSAPLNVLFNQYSNEAIEKQGIICEELNYSQQKAIENSNNRVISVISGPPGTGKSFTIANLAAEKVSKGQSVLITSKNKEALAVIEDKIKVKLGIANLCVNPSQDSNFIWMKEYLDFILGRRYHKKAYQLHDIEHSFANYQKMYDLHLSKEQELLLEFKRQKGIYQLLHSGMAARTSTQFKQRIFEKRSQLTLPLWELLTKYYKRIDRVRRKAVANLQLVTTFMLEESIKKYRKELRDYLSFLRARSDERKESFATRLNYDAILKAFPLWLVRANDISRVLPQKKEVFDVLIIDESSQCDIPSIIPLLQRAKKVIVVGDAKQLTHISFVSKAFEASCKQSVANEFKHLCRHRDYSVLDLVNENLDPLDTVQLNEHFRSQFPIIAFSNSSFYRNELDILTKRPISVAEHVSFIPLTGSQKKGVNEEEAIEIIKRIREQIDAEIDLPETLKTSIGILSPFRKQVDYLFNVLITSFTIQEIKQHQLIVGTAFTFQGNERDLMHISFALDDTAASGSFTYLNRKDVFNVSITRAKNRQLIYHSFSEARLKPNTLLAHFFRFYKHDLSDDVGQLTVDKFCLEVGHVLKEKGYPIWTNFEVSGVQIDLLTAVDGQFLGIDLIGYPGEMEDYYSLERYKMIERGKIKLFPLPYSLWKGDNEKSVAAILDLLAPQSNNQNNSSHTENEEDESLFQLDSATTTLNAKSVKKQDTLTVNLDESNEANYILRINITGDNDLTGSIALVRKPTTAGKGRLFVQMANFDLKKYHYLFDELLMNPLLEWCNEQKKVNQIYWYLDPKDHVLLDLILPYGFVKDRASWRLMKESKTVSKMHRYVNFFER